MLLQTVSVLNIVLPPIQDLISESYSLIRKKYKAWSEVLHLSCVEALAWEERAMLAYLWPFWSTDPFAEGGEVGAQGEYTQMC